MADSINSQKSNMYQNIKYIFAFYNKKLSYHFAIQPITEPMLHSEVNTSIKCCYLTTINAKNVGKIAIGN